MIKVRTLNPHANAYGAAHEKKKGDVYEADETHTQQLVASGLVEIVQEAKAPEAAPAKPA